MEVCCAYWKRRIVQYIANELETGEWTDSKKALHFHDALYYTVMTFTTVGYGDVAPEGVVGRLVMLVIISVTFVLVPFETSKLVRVES